MGPTDSLLAFQDSILEGLAWVDFLFLEQYLNSLVPTKFHAKPAIRCSSSLIGGLLIYVSIWKFWLRLWPELKHAMPGLDTPESAFPAHTPSACNDLIAMGF